ncbi:SGNH/GDSL hydrolase family protein [Brachybacterium tyrofermentans]|uniref:SGNH/GDSL hydrolase family protein n=1 Tax=Brachybacterium tyrofermentans TaxID=47848 RepID=UPI003FD081EF
MASDSEMSAAGIHLPGGGDYMNLGDDAISANASVLWDRVEGARFDRTATALKVTDDLHALPPGRYGVWGGAVAEALGLPEAQLGVVDVSRFGSGVAFLEYRPRTLDGARIWQQTLFGSTWLEWERVDAGAVRTDQQGTMRRGFRTVPLALTRGRGEVAKPATGSVRFPTGWNAPVTRWRIHMQNVNPRYGTAGTGTHTVTGFWVGDHDGDGAMSNVQQVHGSATIPNSTEWVSPWFTVPVTGARMLSLGWSSSGGTPIGIQGGCWQTSASADAATPAPARAIQQTAPFSLWIEAETYASTPVVAVTGDSLAVGANATLPIHDSVISVYAREHGALPVHYAASGDSMAASLNPEHFKWHQFDDCDAPDSILWAMGSNDVFGDPTLAEMKDRHAQYGAILATITPNIYGATLAPRTVNQDAGIRATRRAYNTWLGTQPDGIRDVFDFVTPVSADDLTIRPSMDADGTHYNSSGYVAQAAAIIRPIAEMPEPPAGPYDSGLRNVRDLIVAASGWDTARATLTATLDRQGPSVNLSFTNLMNTAEPLPTGWVEVMNLPIGFRPSADQYDRDFAGGRTRVLANGTVQVQNPSSTLNYFGFNFTTRNNPPTSPPGAPA